MERFEAAQQQGAACTADESASRERRTLLASSPAHRKRRAWPPSASGGACTTYAWSAGCAIWEGGSNVRGRWGTAAVERRRQLSDQQRPRRSCRGAIGVGPGRLAACPCCFEGGRGQGRPASGRNAALQTAAGLPAGPGAPEAKRPICPSVTEAAEPVLKVQAHIGEAIVAGSALLAPLAPLKSVLIGKSAVRATDPGSAAQMEPPCSSCTPHCGLRAALDRGLEGSRAHSRSSHRRPGIDQNVRRPPLERAPITQPTLSVKPACLRMACPRA